MLALTLVGLAVLMLLVSLRTMRRVYVNIALALVLGAGFSCLVQPLLDSIIGPKIVGPTSEWPAAIFIGLVILSLAAFIHWVSTTKLSSLR